MKRVRLQKPARATRTKRAERDKEDGERGRQEVREDVRKAWFPEDV